MFLLVVTDTLFISVVIGTVETSVAPPKLLIDALLCNSTNSPDDIPWGDGVVILIVSLPFVVITCIRAGIPSPLLEIYSVCTIAHTKTHSLTTVTI